MLSPCKLQINYRLCWNVTLTHTCDSVENTVYTVCFIKHAIHRTNVTLLWLLTNMLPLTQFRVSAVKMCAGWRTPPLAVTYSAAAESADWTQASKNTRWFSSLCLTSRRRRPVAPASCVRSSANTERGSRTSRTPGRGNRWRGPGNRT